MVGTFGSRDLWWDQVTVKDGERLAVWDRRGHLSFIDGPSRSLLFFKKIEFVKRFDADSQHYLSICYKDGKKEHIPGPTFLFFDPLRHKSISVSHSINLNNDEAMVVYQQTMEDGASQINRKIIKGPALYTPSSSEWVQEFLWGQSEDSDASGETGQTKLKLVPEQMFVDVDNVRTTDDALLTLNFMIVFQLQNIERMLAETHDPISDFTTAVCSDVLRFSSKLTFEAFKGFTDELNKISAYTNLLETAQTDGFRIVNVVFRGYQPTAALKAMQERNVEVRTRLQLERETEEQQAKLLAFKQHAKFERDQERYQMEILEKEHEIAMGQMTIEEKLRHNGLEFESQLKSEKDLEEQKLSFEEKRNERELGHYAILHDKLGVDLTKFLIAKTEAKPNQVIKLKTDHPDTSVHVHS